MIPFDVTPGTVVVLLVLAVLVVLAVRRLTSNGLCDCHKGDGRTAGGAPGGCAGCAGCAASGGCSACSVAADLAQNADRR
ncbi:hypothetical protein [Xiamenia xianingshaonis]|uniref:FeoB-associated Cys-rich membrane protein n=1 Tax=Xiamenia xianingshaonis TaxID=2682776 RepID=A0A9E6MR04_9ACTN|nr:hypothetical protein [Xiamenia xianingshaonis]NGM16465.1 hypothetical protein [Eggerthellaceae bacterium zg-893]NHM13429.1 hypothetical protein [Xiamenia xianingshaonis]QTU84493.1 hypothetical protein J7S26_00735 [Xiamenia xianingshaonis]